MATEKNGGQAEQAFTNLKALVSPDWELREKCWEERLWTTGGALVHSLAECVSHGFLGKPGEVKKWLLWYAQQDYTKNPAAGPQTSQEADTAESVGRPEGRLGVALAFVFCAELALRQRENTQEGLGALLYNLRNGRESGCVPAADWFKCQLAGCKPVTFDWLQAERPQTIRTMRQLLADEDWVWGCIRTLQGAPVLGGAMRPAVCAPLVGVDLRGQAMVHTFVVEVLNHGAGKVFRHPRDAFDTEPAMDAQFAHSMRTAFRTALDEVNLGKCETERLLADGRWRLLHGWKWKTEERGKLRPLLSPTGASASGAAARLWWFALSGKVSDDRVIVIAQVNDAGQVVAVENESIAPKLEAVIQAVIPDSQQGWQHFDTVAVVGDNLKPARDAVEAAVKQDRIRSDQLEVVDIAHPEDRRSRAAAGNV